MVLFQSKVDQPIPKYVLPEIFRQKEAGSTVSTGRHSDARRLEPDYSRRHRSFSRTGNAVLPRCLRPHDTNDGRLDSARDLVNSALEIQLAVTSNRQNEVAKQLTIIAT